AKTIKTFLATWTPVGGAIRVVLVREPHGWLAFFCTDPEVTAEKILHIEADGLAAELLFRSAQASASRIRVAGIPQAAYAANVFWSMRLAVRFKG
ncbi:MAG: hypothetical protein LC674_01340, partial [Actinobacteria bacterium]|nr:hypothetical protein [Actinomycetota bacterium]